jgi:glycosyltransferase involved in cell wall biosynthesis
VVDDASTDETAEVCRKIENIKYVRVDRNQHTAGARNIGILNSTAPYIGFLDDDDWRLPGTLDKQVALLDENQEIGLVYGRYFHGDQDGKIIGSPAIPQVCPQGDIFHDLFDGNMIGCLTGVFRKQCIYRVGMLDANYSGIDDWDLWIRIAELYQVLALEEPVAVWRKAEAGSGQGSSNTARIYHLAIKAFNKKWSNLPRIKEGSSTALINKRKFYKKCADVVINEVAYSSSNKVDQLLNLYQVLNIYPQYLVYPSFYKVLIKNVLFK